MTIRIVLVDDEMLIRSGLRLMIESQSDLRVIGEATDGHAGIAEVTRLRPDVVLMDIQMPNLSGIDAAVHIAELDDPPRVVMLTTFGDDRNIFESLRAGASAFLLKDSRPEDVIEAIRVVARGDALLSPLVTRRLVDQFVASAVPQSVPERYDLLTEREREVLGLMADGLSNQEIADRVFVSFSTAKTHVSSILTKLGLRDRVHAVIYAYQNGLVRRDEA